MTASPAPSPLKFVQDADSYVVLLGQPDGSAPENPGDQCLWLIPTTVSVSAGADRLDMFQCRVDFTAGGKRLQNTTTPIGFKRQVELRRLDEDGEPTEVVAWGMLTADGQDISLEESETVTARMDHYLFGKLLEDVPYWDPVASEVRYVNLPAVLNPLIDDKLEPNKSNLTNSDRGESPLFYHPESHRLTPSALLQGQTAEEWTFKTAVHWLCWHLNPDETYIKNPTLEDLATAFPTEAGFTLRNVSLKYGRFLPQLLDDLLNPFGFGWHLVHSLTASGTRKTKFRFFQKGIGELMELYLQPIGQTINYRQTNVNSFRLDYDVSKLANEVIGHGDHKLYEATFMLYPAWDPELDDTDVEQLATGHPDNVQKRDVARKYVANEAGDYDDLRPWIQRQDLTEIIGENHVIRRRKFLPCISQHASADDETSNGFVLQRWDTNEDGATDPLDVDDPGWVKVKHPYQILEKECGIMFSGSTPPVDDMLQLITSATDPEEQPLYLRITCSIAGDEVLSYRATRRASSPNGLSVPMLLDLNDRFKFREVNPISVFDGTAADTKDDSEKLQTYCERTRDNNDQAEVSVSVTLQTSNHPEYKIGQLIGALYGRNLTFNANGDAYQQRMLQIVGINRSLDSEQRTELLLESFELERRELMVST